jgi:protein-S-isoprenylcysteine O-methyltransferase Ste14
MTSVTDVKALIPVCISIAIASVCLFGSAGRLDWLNAWVLLSLSFVAGLAFTLGRDPELSAERRNVKVGKSWDKVLVGITVLIGPMAIWITAGLDRRFHWSKEMSSSALGAGVGAAILAAALVTWAMRTNKFFSSVVRIQKDRGHTVVKSGPYRFIRHPGYAGMSVFNLVTPVILGSYWALLPAAANTLLIVFRTLMEDATLRTSLMVTMITCSGCRTGYCPPSGKAIHTSPFGMADS